MSHDPRLLPQEKIESIAYACEQVKQKGSNNVTEIQWRRKALLLLAHIAALQDRLTVAEARAGARSHHLPASAVSADSNGTTPAPAATGSSEGGK